MRIAAPTPTVGLPEVALCLVPGAGDTQRLPRLIGLGRAVELIVEGRPRFGRGNDTLSARNLGWFLPRTTDLDRTDGP